MMKVQKVKPWRFETNFRISCGSHGPIHKEVCYCFEKKIQEIPGFFKVFLDECVFERGKI